MGNGPTRWGGTRTRATVRPPTGQWVIRDRYRRGQVGPTHPESRPSRPPAVPASFYPRDRPEARPRRPQSYLSGTPGRGRRLTSRWATARRARSARRNYTAPSPPTSPTPSTVHTLLATDSSILTVSSPLFTRYSVLIIRFAPSLPFPPSFAPSLLPSFLVCLQQQCTAVPSVVLPATAQSTCYSAFLLTRFFVSCTKLRRFSKIHIFKS